jgi:hypothetical protein
LGRVYNLYNAELQKLLQSTSHADPSGDDLCISVFGQDWAAAKDILASHDATPEEERLRDLEAGMLRFGPVWLLLRRETGNVAADITDDRMSAHRIGD